MKYVVFAVLGLAAVFVGFKLISRKGALSDATGATPSGISGSVLASASKIAASSPSVWGNTPPPPPPTTVKPANVAAKAATKSILPKLTSASAKSKSASKGHK